jgi:hypothetical protein
MRLSAEPAQAGLVGGEVGRTGDASGKVFGKSQRGTHRGTPALLNAGPDGVPDDGGLRGTALFGEGKDFGDEGVVQFERQGFHNAILREGSMSITNRSLLYDHADTVSMGL